MYTNPKQIRDKSVYKKVLNLVSLPLSFPYSNQVSWSGYDFCKSKIKKASIYFQLFLKDFFCTYKSFQRISNKSSVLKYCIIIDKKFFAEMNGCDFKLLVIHYNH